MGADLILAYVPTPCYVDKTVCQTFTQTEGKYEFTLNDEGKRVRAVVEARIRALDEDTRKRLIEDAYPMGEGDEDEGDTVKPFLDAFDEVFGQPYGRDTTDLQIEGRWYTFTGGMSWGDTPTDSFDAVALLGGSGVLIEPFGDKR